MGLFAPAAQRLARRSAPRRRAARRTHRRARVSGCRLWGGTAWVLYAGTFLAGVGIAIGGTLLPGLVKALFPPHRTGLGHRPLHAGDDGRRRARRRPLSVPLAELAGVLAGLARVVEPARRRRRAGLGSGHRASARHRAANPVRRLRTRPALAAPHRLAGGGVHGAAVVVFYSCLAWVAPSFQDRGWDATTTGYLLSVFSGVQVCSGLLGPLLADRIHDRRVLLLSASVFGAAGPARPGRRPRGRALAVGGVLGMGQGPAFSLGHGAADRLLPHARRAAAGSRRWCCSSATPWRRGGRRPWARCGTRPAASAPVWVDPARSRGGADRAGDPVPAHAPADALTGHPVALSVAPRGSTTTRRRHHAAARRSVTARLPCSATPAFLAQVSTWSGRRGPALPWTCTRADSRPGLGPADRAVGLLDRHDRQRVGVVEVEADPRGAPAELHVGRSERQDSAPGREEVADGEALARRDRPDRGIAPHQHARIGDPDAPRTPGGRSTVPAADERVPAAARCAPTVKITSAARPPRARPSVPDVAGTRQRVLRRASVGGRWRRGHQSRQAAMSVTRIARAPELVQLVHDLRWCASAGTMARTATQPLSCSGDTVGDSSPGVSAQACSTSSTRHVVVHHHVAARGQDALQPAAQDLDGRRSRAVLAADQHRLAAQDRLAEDLEALVAQRGAGLDDVGDDVGDPEGDRGLDGAVEPDHVTADAVLGQVRLDQPGVAGGHPQAVDVLDASATPGRAAKRKVEPAKPSCMTSIGAAARVEQQVAAGDAAGRACRSRRRRRCRAGAGRRTRRRCRRRRGSAPCCPGGRGSRPRAASPRPVRRGSPCWARRCAAWSVLR